MMARQLLRSALACASTLLGAAMATAQSGWVDFVDESATRLVGGPDVLFGDLEKDLCAADLDLDGDLDLVVGRKHAFTFTGERPNVLFMNEGGVLVDRTAELAPSFAIPSNTRDLLAFDADGDGWPDLVEANTLYDPPRFWFNRGEDANGAFLGFEESFEALASMNGLMVKFCSVSAADIDGDGDLDLHFGDYRNTTEDILLVNDGHGIFADETATRMSASAAQSLFAIDDEFADFNGDGAPDLLKVEDNALPLRIIYNDGLGFFFEEQALSVDRTHQALPADFDNDGRLDLYVVDSGQDYLFMNGGNGANGQVVWTQMPVTESPRTAGPGGNVIEADLDRDGYVDVLVADVDAFVESCARRFAALRNLRGENGFASFEDPNAARTMPWNTQGVHDAVAFDVDGDGFLDLVQGTCSGLKLWRMQPFALPGSSYCVTTEHSAGPGARIHAVGSANVAANDFRLVVEGGVPGQLGIFFYGTNQVQLAFGNGLRCVGGTTFRLHPSLKMGASGGLASRRVDFDAPPASAGPGQIAPGTSWNFQFWFRDPAAGGASFDLSDGLAVDFGA